MKIRTDFVTNSSSSSYICFKVKSRELVEYLAEIINENFMEDIDYGRINIISDDEAAFETFGYLGEKSIDDVFAYYADAQNMMGYSDEEMEEEYGSFDDCCSYSEISGGGLPHNSEIYDIVSGIVDAPEEVKSKIKSLIEKAELIKTESAYFETN